MTPQVWGVLIGAGTLAVMAFTFYLTYVRPKQAIRGRVLDKLLGNDGKDGLPREPSIFESLADLKSTLTSQGEILKQLADEFPKNGIPTRAALDRVADDLRRSQSREDQRWATLTAALLAHNIRIPPEGG